MDGRCSGARPRSTPQLGASGALRLRRQAPIRGRIVAQDGTVFARTRGDGARVYPQEWLAGQTIGYATPATAEDLKDLHARGVRRGDLVGRSGLEAGADAAAGRQLRASSWSRSRPTADPVTVLQRKMVPGADVEITIRPSIQATADATLGPLRGGRHRRARPEQRRRVGAGIGTALQPELDDHRHNHRWRAAGGPRRGRPDLNHATLAAYPAGSSFKVFTLAAALKIGVADPSTRMTCNGTWPFSGFTFHNYLDHSLPGLVDLLQAMAFSCNTTYMPLSIRVYDRDKTALTELRARVRLRTVHRHQAPGR